MIRVILTAVLMLLVSLPHGMCVCHAFEDEHAKSDLCESPADVPDDVDHDCPCCQLKPTLACDAVQVRNEGAGVSLLAFERISSFFAYAIVEHKSRDSSTFPPSIPLPLLHCALRI